jgi:hypothetical protein
MRKDFFLSYKWAQKLGQNNILLGQSMDIARTKKIFFPIVLGPLVSAKRKLDNMTEKQTKDLISVLLKLRL